MPLAQAPISAPAVELEQPADIRPGAPAAMDNSRAVPMPESRRAKAIVRPAPPPVPSLGARLWGKASALLARFSLRR